MQENQKLLTALILGAVASNASAGAFQLLEQNASGIGNAYAGSAAVAENASTIFYNPAGMTELMDREYSIGLTAIKPSLKFSDNGSSVDALSGYGTGGDAGKWGLVPNGHMSWASSKDLRFGLSVGAPFGLMAKYDHPWKGSALSDSFDVKTLNINPSAAYRVNDTLSVGGGLNWQRLQAEYLRVAGASDIPVPGLGNVPKADTSATAVKLSFDGESWGWNAGAMLKLAPETRLGLSYRSKVKYDVSGKISASGPNANFNSAVASNMKATIELPDSVIASLAHELNDRWQLLGDVSWTGWSSIAKLDVIRTSGPGSGTIAQTLVTDFRNAWRIALGANYKYNDDGKLKMGIAYDQTPVKNASTRLASLPDNDRLWLSTGVQWKVTKESTVDVGVAYLIVKDAPIDSDQTATGQGRLTGTYKDSGWMIGSQYSSAF